MVITNIQFDAHCVKLSMKKNKTYCTNCGKLITAHALMCRNCLNVFSRKVENRPEPLDLAKLVKENGFEAVGRMFDVSGRTIKDWCTSYSIPSKLKELIDWYNQQMGIMPEQKRQRTPISEIVRPIKQIDKQTGKVINIFQSIKEAARVIGHPNGDRHIGKVCHGERKSAFGYIWEFA